MSDTVMVKLDNGETAQVSRVFAENKGLTIVDPDEQDGALSVEERAMLVDPRMAAKVRVKLDNGAEATVAASYAAVKGLKVLNKPASDRFGRALRDKPKIDLAGKALDQALEDAGLPTTGRADEKRQRLADHQSSSTSVPANTNQ